MNPFFTHILTHAILLFLIQELLPGIQIQGFLSLILSAVVFFIIQVTIRPFFILLALPINILTLGLFTLVINALMLRLTALLVPGFTIFTFGAAFLGALILTISHSLLFQRIRFEK